MAAKVSELLADIMAAVSNTSLYSKDHAAVVHLSERAVSLMEDLYDDDGSLSFTILGDKLLYNQEPVQEKGIHIYSFIRKFRRRGIENVAFKKGVTPEELSRLVGDLASGEEMAATYPHISLGAVEVGLIEEGGGGEGYPEDVFEENTEKFGEIYSRVSKFKKLDVVGLEEVVVSFMSNLKGELSILKAASPVKAHSEYTFSHITNVSILSMYQAEHLGIKGDLLHDIGLAGLLHDVGKMFVSKDIIEKPGKLDDDEWAEMQKHPTYGAMYLCMQSDVPKISIVGAFEHHMKFNGTGYPRTRRRSRKQHIVSQIIAISDFFDALRTERSYRRALEVPVTVGIMKETSGKDFNPLLVDNFLNALSAITPIT